jgi:adenosylmethionine-8-amino-7-oxononanoate aminotransferase
MTFAKGVTSGYVPLGGVMVGDRVAKVLIEQGGEFAHGYTYSGHPVACAVALANIRLIQQQGWCAMCATTWARILLQPMRSWPSTRWWATPRPAA